MVCGTLVARFQPDLEIIERAIEVFGEHVAASRLTGPTQDLPVFLRVRLPSRPHRSCRSIDVGREPDVEEDGWSVANDVHERRPRENLRPEPIHRHVVAGSKPLNAFEELFPLRNSDAPR